MVTQSTAVTPAPIRKATRYLVSPVLRNSTAPQAVIKPKIPRSISLRQDGFLYGPDDIEHPCFSFAGFKLFEDRRTLKPIVDNYPEFLRAGLKSLKY